MRAQAKAASLANTRLKLISAIAAALAALTTTLGLLQAQAADAGAAPAAPHLTKAQAGFLRTSIGKVEVVSLSDGAGDFNIDGLALNGKPGEIDNLLALNFEKSPILCSINAYLLHLNGKWMLIDTGASELLGPSNGKIVESLKNSGVQPEEITDVFITHMHPDHAGGLMNGDKKVFANAKIHINKKELDFWFDQATADKAPESMKKFFVNARAKVKPYVDAGQVETFVDGVQLVPGLSSIPAYGHTPGHTFYALEDSGQKLVFWGDMIHLPGVQFENPNVAMVFDVDSAAAIKTRQAALADIAAGGYEAAADHMPFPGIGHVRKEGDHFRWISLPYCNDAITK